MTLVESQSLVKTEKAEKYRFHWTVDTFYRAVDAGVFDEPKRLELVSGDLWEKELMNPPHAVVTDRVARLFRRLFEPQFIVREEKPLHLADDTEPLPDVLVTAGVPEDYERRHPSQADAQLVVEVADATLERDMGEKARLYAGAGIADYWVCDLNGGIVHVFREPTPSGYASHTRHGAGESIAPLCASNVAVRTGDLLPRPQEIQETNEVNA